MQVPREPITPDEIERLRQRIGVELRFTPNNTEVSLDALRRFVGGVGDPNPLWTDLAYGEKTHHGTVIAPPSFLHSVVIPSGALAGGLPGVHLMDLGSAWRFHRVVRLGERLRAAAKLLDVDAGKGRGGEPQVRQTVGVQYFNQRDELLAECTAASLRFRRPSPEEGPLYSVEAGRYSVDEQVAIEDASLQEKPRGGGIRYWEDVAQGDELEPVVKGPLAFGDVESFLAGCAAVPALGNQAAYVQRHPFDTYRDETNYPQPLWHVALSRELAQEAGFPYAHDIGAQRVCWLVQMLTNWMGDDGRLLDLSVRLRRPNFHGDVTWCRGSVRRKLEADGETVVECEVRCENQRGERTAEGEARVALLSRSVTLWGRALTESVKAASS